MISGSLGSIYGKKLIVSSAVLKSKDVIVPIHVPRRGITINRKRQELVPFMGVMETNDAYFIHPAFEGVLRKSIGDQLTENMNELALKAWGL